MKIKLLSAMDTKKKLGTLIVCGALVAALGTASAALGTTSTFAANTISSLHKIENGVKLYSTDGGKTWSKQAPEGVTEKIDADGKVTITNGTPPEVGASFTKGDDGTKATYTRGIPDGVPDLMIKIEKGVKLYSTDGGKTWSDQAPEGVTETVGEDGKVTTSYGIAPKEGEDDGILSKVENGIRTYSTDGGKTWSGQDPRDADESSTIGN